MITLGQAIIILIAAGLLCFWGAIRSAPQARCKCGRYDVMDDDVMCAECAAGLGTTLFPMGETTTRTIEADLKTGEVTMRGQSK